MSNSEEFQKTTNAYNASIELWKLASQQVYSRFAAMLTANSIIIAVVGLTLAARADGESCLLEWLAIALVVAGWALCIVWAFFVPFMGVRVENYYRDRAKHFERTAIPDNEQVAIRRSDSQFYGFKGATIATISVFVCTYSALLAVVLNI